MLAFLEFNWGLICYLICNYLISYLYISIHYNLRLVNCFASSWLLHRCMSYLQLLFTLLVCDGLQTVAEVMTYDRDRVASMIARDVSRTTQAPRLNFVCYTGSFLLVSLIGLLLSGLTWFFGHSTYQSVLFAEHYVSSLLRFCHNCG